MAESHLGFKGLTTTTFEQLSKLYSATKEHNFLTRVTFETTETIGKGIYHRIIGEQEKVQAEIDSSESSLSSSLLCSGDSIIEQVSLIEKRHPFLAKGSSYTLAISRKVLEDFASVSMYEGENNSQLVKSVHQLASRTLKTLGEALDKKPELSRCESEGQGLVALCEVVKAVSDDLWDLATKEILPYNPAKLVHETVEDAYDKVNSLKDSTTARVKNLTASAIDEVTSVTGQMISIGEGTIQFMTELVTKNPLTATSVGYLHSLVDGVKCLPIVSATVEGLALFREYILISQPASFDQVLDLPEVNVVVVDDDDFHFIPQLPAGRRRFFVFIGTR